MKPFARLGRLFMWRADSILIESPPSLMQSLHSLRPRAGFPALGLAWLRAGRLAAVPGIGAM